MFFNVKEKLNNWDKTKLIARQGFGNKDPEKVIGSLSTYDLEKQPTVANK